MFHEINIGDEITILQGVFASFEGIVVEIDDVGQSAIVEIPIYGKRLPITLKVDELRKSEN